MGPIALFDKSFLQSLSVDDSVWFDQFFMPIVCPIFYVETLADLAKSPPKKGTVDSAVSLIAAKFPEFGAKPVVHHLTLCRLDLMGERIPMDGRPPISGGRQVIHNGKAGVVFDESPEAMAFSRWRDGQFYELERDFAKDWRQSLAALNLRDISASFVKFGIQDKRFKNLDEVKATADELVNGADKKSDMMLLAINMSGLPREFHTRLFELWTNCGQPPLSTYAPYAAHVVKTEIFFQLAVASDLISPDRVSNKMDVAYLFYMPFCMIFASGDKLHRNIAPLFMRADQTFTWGPDLKQALSVLNNKYLLLPEEVRDLGISSFASIPPTDSDGIVVSLWDRYSPKWRERGDAREKLDVEKGKEIVASYKGFVSAPEMPIGSPRLADEEIDGLMLQHRVHKRKGSWYQLPKDLPPEADISG